MKPIIFSTDMVRRIACGLKTQTRRIIRPNPPGRLAPRLSPDGTRSWFCPGSVMYWPCPFVIGSLLWVRETWAMEDGVPIYRALFPDGAPPEVKWKPSIFMPRELSRITLIVKDVRYERVREISRVDAIAEGFERERNLPIDPRDWFRNLWDGLNAKRGYSWDKNPHVWAVTFAKVWSESQWEKP